MSEKVLVCGSRVRWCLVPDQPFILKSFHFRGDGTHHAVIAEDKPYGVTRPVPTSELEELS